MSAAEELNEDGVADTDDAADELPLRDDDLVRSPRCCYSPPTVAGCRSL